MTQPNNEDNNIIELYHRKGSAPKPDQEVHVMLDVIPSITRKPDWQFEYQKKSKPFEKTLPIVHDLRVPKDGITLFHLHVRNGAVFYGYSMTLSPKFPLMFYRKYFNLKTVSDTYITFYAEYIELIYGARAYRHPCLFWVRPRRPTVADIPIDPDILNPGDHP